MLGAVVPFADSIKLDKLASDILARVSFETSPALIMLPDFPNKSTSNRRLPNYQPMVLVVLAFGSGVGLDRCFNLDWRLALVISWIGFSGWFILTRRRKSFRQLKSLPADREAIASTLLLVGLMCAGAFWHHGRWNWFGEYEIGRYASRVATRCCIEGEIISEPRWQATEAGNRFGQNEADVRWKLTVRVRRIRDGNRWRRATGITDLIIHAPAGNLRSGDRIRVFGRLVGSTPPTNPGQFDFRKFYRARNRLAFFHAYHRESVMVLRAASWNHSSWLSRLRQNLNRLTWRYVDHQEAPFASAILLGNREQMTRPRRDAFMETGTIHLLAISGLHVGILAGSFFWLFRIGIVSRNKCLWATILFVIFYAWLVEFRPPVTRAAILVTMFCIGRLEGQKSFSFNLLAMAGLVVLLINPSDLFAIGPQLSFLAVATLTFGKTWIFWPPSTDPIERLIANSRPWPVRTLSSWGRQVRTAFLACGLIWLVAMPMVAFRFHLLAPIALLVNPFLLLPIAWGLYAGLGVLVFGWFLPPAASVFGWICDRNLALIEWMIGAAQAVSWGHSWTPGPPGWAVSLFYGGIFLFCIYPVSRLHGRWLAVLLACWLSLCWWIPDRVVEQFNLRTDRSLTCTFIDVGHGTSVLIQLPDGKNVLYDAGALGAAEFGARNIAGVLWSERINHLDAVVLSHADVDHFNAMTRLAEQFSIGGVYVTPQMMASPSSAVMRMFDVFKLHQIPIHLVSAGDELPWGEATTAHVVGPPIQGTGDSDNSDSLVLLIDYQGRKILLPGDLERAGLALLLNLPPVDCDVVMAAHHGSANSMPEALMEWSTPEFVIISSGSQRVSEKTVARFQGPHRESFRTDQSGAVRVVIRRSEVEVRRWNDHPW